jgi:type IV pilus assembly protein PilC
MINFTYQAKDAKTGKKVKARVQADSEQAAAKLIREQGLTPLSIKADRGETGFHVFHRIRTKDKVLFSRQLATLINAGLPLVQSLRQVGEQTTNKNFQIVINQIISDVEAGTAFSAALEKHPTVFDRVFISLVAAGEASGTLDTALERLANQQEKDADIISKVRGAMIYPCIVFLVMIAVVIFMVVKVLPEVQSIYKGLPGVSLPLPTTILLDVSHIITHFWWLIILLIVAASFFGSRWARTVGGRSVVDSFKMRAWPVGPLFMKMYMARFARTGSTLVAAGVPLIQMLEITGDAVNNVHVQASIRRSIEKVKGGKALSDSLKGDPNFLPLVPNMLHIGEQSGAMEVMLTKVADYYEKEVDNEIKAINTIIEPVMMIIMGIIAMIIVAAVLLPIYGLVNQSGFTNNI